MSGGGGSSSSKAGGLKEGLRNICMGLLTPELGSWTWAAWGLVRFGEGMAPLLLLRLDEDAIRPLRRLLSVGSRNEGEFRRLGAPGHPHS